jgi:NTE family protein
VAYAPRRVAARELTSALTLVRLGATLEEGKPVNEESRELLEALGPTRPLPGESPGGEPQAGIGLCLSGGGYRAMLFHAGCLWRLNEAGYLSRLDRVSSVSGGSITAGQLAVAWPDLGFADGVASRFVEQLVAPLRRLAGETIDRAGIVRGILTPGTIAEKVADAYRKHLFGDRTLQNLPDTPRFVINAANLQSAVLWRFSKPYMRDYRVGSVENPTVDLATAVAASAAFPPFLSPVRLRVDDAAYTPGSGDDLQRPPFTTEVVLVDGGVYDNLGLETVWKRYRTVLVSDGGGHISAQAKPASDWLRQTPRVISVIDSQVRALRKRQVIGLYRLGLRDGAYWGIRSDIGDYGLPDALPCDLALTRVLADTPTRLARMGPLLQERLVNWGYAVCDAALRAHVDPSLPAPIRFPYPSAAVG